MVFVTTFAVMMEIETALIFEKNAIPQGTVAWQSPSNIALVKYWGKKEHQIPCNASVSFTLDKSVSKTTVHYTPSDSQAFQLAFYLDGERNEKFEKKISMFFQSILHLQPFLNQLSFTIHSSNTFPHSAGIASSASGMSALALCLCQIEQNHFQTLTNTDTFLRKASTLARLGSGSACRSVYGGLVVWGETSACPQSANKYAVPLTENVHPVFHDYCDTILIIDAGQKSVSSRAGHELMHTNPFAVSRFRQASENMEILLKAISGGDLDTFIRITESEALTLHAMMMTSEPSYMLMRPNTIQVIERIRAFRSETGIPVCFTLDAGPNVHTLYPAIHKKEVLSFIKNELIIYLYNSLMIEDGTGNGPKNLDV
ncbi:MAG: diphosphomevalonate decarboxylase [Flavobacteriales bacterium]|nr:diphosphomevalonate decarboxylase [Flavobacteriales bacterium]